MFQFLSIIRVQDYQGGTQSLATIITGLYDVQDSLNMTVGCYLFLSFKEEKDVVWFVRQKALGFQ